MEAMGRVTAIDFANLETQVAGDLGIVREVLGLFSEQARTVLMMLDPASPPDAWRNAAHSLKGSSLSIGAFTLAEACSDAEMAPHASVAEKRALRARIAECLSAALTDIAAYTAR